MQEKTVFEVLFSALLGGEDEVSRVALTAEERTPRGLCRMPPNRLVEALAFDPRARVRAYFLQEAAEFCLVWGNTPVHYEKHTTAQIRELLLALGGVDTAIADAVLTQALGLELTRAG